MKTKQFHLTVKKRKGFFLVWSLVLLVASIPLTPGGVGFVEAAYIAAAKEKGIGFLECPLGKTPAQAETAEEPIFVGGDETVYQKVKDILEIIGNPVTYLGTVDADPHVAAHAGERIDVERDLVGREHDQAAHLVLELAHVSGPVVGGERALHLVGQDRRLAAGLARRATPEDRELLRELLSDPSPEELRAIEKGMHYQEWDSGYSKQQSTRPQSVGYGLVDSPSAQAAWVIEKFWAWTDNDGDPATAVPPEVRGCAPL